MPRYDKEGLTPVELRLLHFQSNWHYNSYTAHYFWWKKRFLVQRIFSGFLHKCSKTSIRILDLGCGDGYDLFLMAKEASYLRKPTAQDIRFFGIDIDSEKIDYIRKRIAYEGYSDIIEVCQGDIQESLDKFLPAPFDFILCSEVIEHLPESGKAILNISKLLIPGGWAVITTPNSSNIISKLAGWFRQRNRQCKVSNGHISLRNYRDWVKLFHSAGFRIINIRRGPLVYGYCWLDEKPIIAGLLITLDGLIDRFFPLPDLACSTLFLLEKLPGGV